jgi:hypothetical protein
MNSKLPRRTVSPRGKPLHVSHSLSAGMMIIDEGTIGMSRGKACCKPSYLVCQLSVFYAPVRYRVVKITHSSSKVVL